MDHVAPQAHMLDAYLIEQLDHTKNSDDVLRQLACDTSARPDRRYIHHAALRAMACHPDTFEDHIEHYLGGRENWDDLDNDHPSALIKVYRQWLGLWQGESWAEDGATWQTAIDTCLATDKGPVLQWMAQVLAALGQGLGLRVNAEKTHGRLPSGLTDTHRQHCAELAAARNHEARIRHLSGALPFNFH